MNVFGGSLQNWTIFSGHFYAFKGAEWGLFLGVLKFLIFFWGA